jgi:LL-diaminopimelate aminotransferase
VGNSDIIQGLRTLKTNLDYGIFSVIQKAAETALQLPDEYVKQVQERYRQRQGFFNQRFGAIRLGYSPSKATMYLWVPCSVGMTSTDFALSVLQKTGVVVTPGNAFGEGGEGYVRVSLIANIPQLGEALQRLEDAGIRYQ